MRHRERAEAAHVEAEYELASRLDAGVGGVGAERDAMTINSVP